MLIENEFVVAQPVDPLWAYLLDVEKIAPCMPGAELTEQVDDTTWKGKVNVAFGPVKLSFAGSVHIDQRDDAAHRVVLAAKGMEAKGKGAATANITSWLEPVDAASTSVHMQADITLTGTAAQLSRGLLPEDLEEDHAAVRGLPRGLDGRRRGGARIGRRGDRGRHADPDHGAEHVPSTSGASVSGSPPSGR